jgi:hypothetical protein
MKSQNLLRFCALGILLAFAGCGGSNSLPLGLSRQRYATPLQVTVTGWMSPQAKGENLVYVGTSQNPVGVFVYDYKTGALVGELGGFDFFYPAGMCVDASGDVWITDSASGHVVEYAHGSDSPVQTLTTNADPVGCSISLNGDLAVTNYMATNGFSTIQIWKDASGTPATYDFPDACYFMWPPGYDNKGNLYVESQNNVCELPAGGSGLKRIAFDKKIYDPGTVMWDGQYITLTDLKYNNGSSAGIYRAVPMKTGSLKPVGVTLLGYAHSLRGGGVQPFFVGKQNTPVNNSRSKVFVDYISSYSASWEEYYHYESGVPFRSFPSYYNTTGQAVSLAKKQ